MQHSKNTNIVKYYCNLIFFYFYIFYFNILLNVIYSCEAEFSAAIIPVLTTKKQ